MMWVRRTRHVNVCNIAGGTRVKGQNDMDGRDNGDSAAVRRVIL